jgi:hypothetical protein
MNDTARTAELLAGIDAKVADLKTAVREAHALLKDARAERRELRALLDGAADEHRRLLAEMVERSAAEVTRATADAMNAVARQMQEIVTRSQSVQTLVRVDRLMRHVEALVEADGAPSAPTQGDPPG